MIRYRVLLFLLLPAILLLVAGLIVTQDFFGEQRIEVGEEPSDTTEGGVKELRVYVEGEIFTDAMNPDTLYLALTQAALRAVDGQDKANLFCLHGVYVKPRLEVDDDLFLSDAPFGGQHGDSELPVFRIDPPLCNFVDQKLNGYEKSNSLVGDVIKGPGESLELFFDEGQQTMRFYPFDKKAGSWNIYPLVLTPDGVLRKDVGIQLHLIADLADWEEQIALQRDSLRFGISATETLEWPAEILTLELRRTRTQQLLTLLLLGLLTVLILGLVFVKEKSTLLEIAIGVLLSLWGIQSILIPDYINSRTLVHYWVIVLYILLGLVTYVRLVGLPLVSGDAVEAIASLDDELEENQEDNKAGDGPA